ncbi:hypothetical protein NX02_p1205 (plasmid) [Sphingomonas sanxanigenens DSM 19645 = NX02]|uniref:Uncharacterized protein n=1 Tax=Sphingomonas sanxanigenens DSM 19645 = NX02 TaxID=1123269 RepID=A0A0F7JT80_9SPHN|nr:hypothetical protein NX02_p1205 [Sphingomonas sanxanigenens DSM 19645 = NX02]
MPVDRGDLLQAVRDPYDGVFALAETQERPRHGSVNRHRFAGTSVDHQSVVVDLQIVAAHVRGGGPRDRQGLAVLRPGISRRRARENRR